MSELLIRIETPRYVAGVVVRNGLVVQTAPIARWAAELTPDQIVAQCRRRNWRVDVLGPSGPRARSGTGR